MEVAGTFSESLKDVAWTVFVSEVGETLKKNCGESDCNWETQEFVDKREPLLEIAVG